MDACRHLKAIGLSEVPGLAAKVDGARVGITDLNATKDITVFIDFARKGKVWTGSRTRHPPQGERDARSSQSATSRFFVTLTETHQEKVHIWPIKTQ
jgi:hypothetical protein